MHTPSTGSINNLAILITSACAFLYSIITTYFPDMATLFITLWIGTASYFCGFEMGRKKGFWAGFNHSKRGH